jgi:hypothetical protein
MSITPSEAEEFTDTHMHGTKDTVLFVVGCCSVEYVGRVFFDKSVRVASLGHEQQAIWWHITNTSFLFTSDFKSM